MFQFAGFAPLAGYYAFNIVGCPIRIPTDHIVCADPRSFSQLIASFFASGSLGIPHTPFASLSLCPFDRRKGRRRPLRTLYSLILRVFSQSAHRCAPCPNMSMNSFYRYRILDFGYQIQDPMSHVQNPTSIPWRISESNR